MSRIALVTDSTSYIPQDLVKKYNITVAPQVLIWGKETFEDGVNILPTQFYEKLKNASIMPTTTQVTVVKMHEIFKSLLEQDYQVLAILLSDKLSGTINSAVQALAMLPEGAPVKIVDSKAVAMALGFQVLSAARAIEQGASMNEAVALAEKSTQHTGVIFAVETLEFLHRGGRIGGGKRLLGTALNIKPILELEDGKIEAVESVRTRSKSLTRLVELTEKRIAGRSPVRLATLHANAAEDAQIVLAEATALLKPIETIISEVSPVVGTHAGPGTVGLAFMAGM
jgi:DegV family protein with EDD domain